MKISKEHLFELLGQLPHDVDCDYVIPGVFTLRLNSVEKDRVCFSLYNNGVDTNKNVTLTNEAIAVMADGILENVPVSIDTILVRGNKRSAIEGALIRTSEFYSIKIGRNKNIVWVPSKPHPIGERGIWDENEELPAAPIANTVQMPINQGNLRDDYSLEELGKRFASMVIEENGKNIVVTCTAFGMKYGKAIARNGYKAKDLIDAANKFGANIDHAQDGAVNNGKSLYDVISKRKFGLYFSNRVNGNEEREYSSKTFLVHPTFRVIRQSCRA